MSQSFISFQNEAFIDLPREEKPATQINHDHTERNHNTHVVRDVIIGGGRVFLFDMPIANIIH